MSAASLPFDQKDPSNDESEQSSSHSAGPKTMGEQENEPTFQEMANLLQLPRMDPDEPPSLRILAVADIDLPSAAALAEYSLNSSLGGGNVDMCIACGPCVKDDDVQRYMQGRRRRRITSDGAVRSREEAAALEGLMSAALSQLESIVCRLVYVPHPTDPSTTIFTDREEHLHLTPHSVNVHERWLQLAPGIGCTGYAGITNEQENRPDRDQVQHGVIYTETLRQLLGLAPLSSPQSLESIITFDSPISQAILITQTAEESTVDSNDSSDTYQWPQCHSTFLYSPDAQRHVVLNVASTPPSCPPMDLHRGNVRLVAPGSLREHGDFCIIDVGLHKEDASYRWRVDNVEFHKMNHR